MYNGNTFQIKMKETNIFILLLSLYFFIAPMEDFLTGSFGTVAKYLVIVIVFFGFIKKRGSGKLILNKVNICFLWLMFVSLISILWSIDVTVTINRIFPYIALPGFCMYISMFKYTKNDYEYIIFAAITGGIVASLFAFSQGDAVIYSNRMVLTEGNDPNNFAAVLFLPATLSFVKFRSCKGLISKFYLIFFSLLFLSILYTGSRGALISLVITLLFLFFHDTKKENMYSNIILTLLLFLSIITAYYFLPEALKSRLFVLSSYGAGSERIDIWKTIINHVIPNMSWFGVGAGCEGIAIIPFWGSFKGAHNTYLNMFVEFSFLGLPVFLTLIYFLLRRTLKLQYFDDIALLLGMLVIIFFLDSYAKKFFWNVILLLTIHNNILQDTDVTYKNNELFTTSYKRT